MKLLQRLHRQLEQRWAAPAYGGWVLFGLTLCFFMAAANTMAGWLYVLSGLNFALLLLAAIFPQQGLKGLEFKRSPIYPIHAEESLSLAVEISHRSQQPKGWLLVQDQLPESWGRPSQGIIDGIAPQETYTWQYQVTPQHRGVFRWQTLTIRTGAPLGLFWSRRQQQLPAEAIVYPVVLPLTHCPIFDDLGPSSRQLSQQVLVNQTGNDGSTRSLRPYRWGDPMRLVHWRSSARHNELRIRELEVQGGSETFVIALDTQANWHPDCFEQAVIAAASLYTYARRTHGEVAFWSAASGLIQGNQAVLETLAQISIGAASSAHLPAQPLIWLTASPAMDQVPLGSRYLLWQPLSASSSADNLEMSASSHPSGEGLSIARDRPLQPQLQQTLRRTETSAY